MDISNYLNAIEEAIEAIDTLKNEAENLKSQLDDVIDACETIQCEL